MSNARTISPELQAHLNTRTTSLTALIKITPRDPNYPPVGMAKLDRDVVYDDGGGNTTYHAMVGIVMENMRSTSSMEVGNSLSEHLIPAASFSIDLDEKLIRAGVYDYAHYTVYIVNYEDLSMGHFIPPAGFGQVGQLSVDDRGMGFRMEMTDATKQLKQTIVEKDSISCRAIYGSQPFGTGGGVVEERFPCGATLYWSSTQTVDAVGVENTLSFTASALGAVDNAFVPGMLEWITGDNAGRSISVSTQDSSGDITLSMPTMFPIQIGDTFRIRHDCTKWVYGVHGCQDNFSEVSPTEWKLHYRGEPFIPISDADSTNTPGATVGTGSA